RAAAASCCERNANSSTCSRENPSNVAIRSALMPCGMNAVLNAVSGSQAHGPPSVPIGTRDMDSTPPATTRSSQPERTFCAAMFTASRPEAQKRFSCTPEARKSQPAASAAVLAMQLPCSPTGVTQPITTSSTCAVSRSWRFCSSFSTPVRSVIGFTSCSAPLDLPLPRGVRIASKTIASAIFASKSQRTGDHFLHDFIRATVDARDARVDVGLRDREFPHEAVAAVQLQAFVQDLAFHVRGPKLAHRCGGGIKLLLEQQRHAAVHEHAHYLHLGRDFGQFEARILEARHRLAECLALVHVVDGPAQGRLAFGGRADSDLHALPRQFLHQVDEAVVLLTEQVLGRYLYVVEKEFRRVLALQAHLLQALALGEALHR